MNEIVVYNSKFKMALLAVVALIFVCLTPIIAILEYKAGESVWVVICSGVVVAFFGSGFLYLCHRLIVPKPAVTVNHRGIFDNASVISAGLVEWDEIADVFVYDYNGLRFLGVVPLDVDAFLKRQPVFKRLLMKFTMGTGLPPLNIPQAMLRMKVDQLASEIQKYRLMRGALRERT
jgi:hypothetical protein